MRCRKVRKRAQRWSVMLALVLLLTSFAASQERGQAPEGDDETQVIRKKSRREGSEPSQDSRYDYYEVDKRDIYIRRRDESRNRNYRYRDREGRYYRDTHDDYPYRERYPEDARRYEYDDAEDRYDAPRRDDLRRPGSRYRSERRAPRRSAPPQGSSMEREDDEYWEEYYRARSRYDDHRYTDRDRRDKYREDEYRSRDTFSRGLTPAPHVTLPEQIPFRNTRGSAGTWTKIRSIEVLEDSLVREHQDEWDTLKRFGETFFERSEAELVKSEVATVPQDYEISPGDQLDVTTYSTKGGESAQRLRVDKMGNAFLKGVGPVKAAGKTRSQVEQQTTHMVSSIFPDMRTRVTFANIPLISVSVLGEVEIPGSYQVNPGSSVLDALLHARGPSRSGTYRKIELQRGGKTVAIFDLYNVLVHGKTAELRLRNGDRIFVPMAGKQVAVSGKVNRPAIYELRKKESLAQLIRLAGGARPDAYSPTIQVNRITKNRFRKLVDVSLDNAGQFLLMAGDLVTVESVGRDLKNGVFISGSVKRPGWYEFEPGMTVSQLIERAAGMRAGTYPGHAELYREDGPTKPVRMVGFELDKAIAKDPTNDLRLAARDRVVVYAEEVASYNRDLVRIQGEIARPGEYPRVGNMRIRDLLTTAGGITPEASDNLEIVRTGDKGQLTFIPVKISEVLDSPRSAQNVVLEPLDSVMIRKALRKRRWPASVALTGEFRNPGVYAVDPDRDTLQSLIERAGGLTPEAYPKAAVFTRRLPEILRREEVFVAKEVFTGLLQVTRQIAAVENARRTDTTPAAQGQGLDFSEFTGDNNAAIPPRIIDKTLTSGRVPINLARIVTRGVGDPEVRDGDVLFVPQKPRVVIVSGAVVMPSAVIYHPNKSATAYIKKTGGFAQDAASDRVLVLRVNGELVKSQDVDLIEPGDLILVPPKALIAKPDAFERLLSVLQVVGNTAFLFSLTN